MSQLNLLPQQPERENEDGSLYLVSWLDFQSGETGTFPPPRPWKDACDLVSGLNNLFNGCVGHYLEEVTGGQHEPA